MNLSRLGINPHLVNFNLEKHNIETVADVDLYDGAHFKHRVGQDAMSCIDEFRWPEHHCLSVSLFI